MTKKQTPTPSLPPEVARALLRLSGALRRRFPHEFKTDRDVIAFLADSVGDLEPFAWGLKIMDELAIEDEFALLHRSHLP